ncbi:MAG: hypothetical protein ACXIUD_08695 [Mongoliitalea sp.]
MKTSTRIIIIYFAAFFFFLGASFVYNAYQIKKNPPADMEDRSFEFKFEYKETLGDEVDGDVSIPDTVDSMFVSPDGDVSMPSFLRAKESDTSSN